MAVRLPEVMWELWESPSSITTFKDAKCSKAEHKISSKYTDVLQINNVRGKLEMEEYLSKRVYVHLTVCLAETDTEKDTRKKKTDTL